MAKIANRFGMDIGTSGFNRISKRFIKDMLSKVNIADVLNDIYGLTLYEEKPHKYKAHCPFPDHRDSTPSFFVNDEAGTYKCFGCNRHGDLLEFFMQIDGLSFPEALSRLGFLSGVNMEGELNERAFMVDDMKDMVSSTIKYYGGDRDLPGGIDNENKFVWMLAKRMRNYEKKINFDPDEIKWCDIVYKSFDDCLNALDDNKLNNMWDKLGKRLSERYKIYQEKTHNAKK